MTKQKIIVIVFMLILTAVLFTGCTSNPPELSSPSSPTYAMIRMPDGSIVQGSCSYFWVGYVDAEVVIDGVRYETDIENIVVWKGELK